MPEYELDSIPTISSDRFTLMKSYKVTRAYFPVRIENGVLDTKYMLGWEPVGKSRAGRLLSDGSTIAVMFKFQGTEDETWFHCKEETEDDN